MNADNLVDINEDNILFASDGDSYEKAYEMNGFKVIEVVKLIDVISTVLNEILQETDKIPDQYITSFQGKTVPKIGIKDYLMRISTCSKCSQECFILALIYLDRLTERNRHFILKTLNIHRLLISSVMIAAKFFDDCYYNNEYYARVGGISNAEINVLEIELLNAINFNLYVDPVLFLKYRQRLLSQVADI